FFGLPVMADDVLHHADRIVERVRRGDGDALEALYRQHSESLIEYAASYLRDWDDATEGVQGVFVQLWITRERWAPLASVRAYLFGAVRNRGLNVQRDAKRRSVLLSQENTETIVRITGEHLALDPEAYDAAALARELQRLPERQLSAIRLRYGSAM